MSTPPFKLPSLTTATPDYAPVAVYCGLRDKALRMPGERSTAGVTGMVGVLMEMGFPTAVVTLLALVDGTTSLYFSNGGGVIGAGQHKSVATAASSFLQSAQRGKAQMQTTMIFPLPRPQHTRFYVLDTSGYWTAEAPSSDLGNNQHNLSLLFHSAQAVIAAIRLTSPPRKV